MTRSSGTGSASVQLGKIEAPRPRGTAAILSNPVQGKLRDFVLDNRLDPVSGEMAAVVPPNTHVLESLALCGAGPSLRESVTANALHAADVIWACNSALAYLLAQGVAVDAAIGIDQTPGLLREWSEAPDVRYLVASSCDPELIRHLRAHDRRVQVFHNFVGCCETPEDEFRLYSECYAPTMMVGEGLSVVSRSLGLAQWAGFARVDVHGADCCFDVDEQGHDVAHANGESPDQAYHRPAVAVGMTNGVQYRTRLDMLADAVHLAKRVTSLATHATKPMAVRLMGDTLPVALLGMPKAVLDQTAYVPTSGEKLPEYVEALQREIAHSMRGQSETVPTVERITESNIETLTSGADPSALSLSTEDSD